MSPFIYKAGKGIMSPFIYNFHLLDGIDFWPDVAQWLSSEIIW